MNIDYLTRKLERCGRLKNDEYKELQNAIRTGEMKEWHDLYTSQRVDLKMMNDMTRYMFEKIGDCGYNPFYDMKELVEMVNSWFEIEEPYKPSNKIAYGWQFALEKGYEGFRPYLYGCIRNYLNRNDVEFTTLELQIICCLKDIVKSNGEDWEGLPANAY